MPKDNELEVSKIADLKEKKEITHLVVKYSEEEGYYQAVAEYIKQNKNLKHVNLMVSIADLPVLNQFLQQDLQCEVVVQVHNDSDRNLQSYMFDLTDYIDFDKFKSDSVKQQVKFIFDSVLPLKSKDLVAMNALCQQSQVKVPALRVEIFPFSPEDDRKSVFWLMGILRMLRDANPAIKIIFQIDTEELSPEKEEGLTNYFDCFVRMIHMLESKEESFTFSLLARRKGDVARFVKCFTAGSGKAMEWNEEVAFTPESGEDNRGIGILAIVSEPTDPDINVLAITPESAEGNRGTGVSAVKPSRTFEYNPDIGVLEIKRLKIYAKDLSGADVVAIQKLVEANTVFEDKHNYEHIPQFESLWIFPFDYFEDVSFSEDFTLDENGLGPIIKSLKNCYHLTELVLMNFGLVDQDIEDMKRVFAGLKTINFRSNDITNKGFMSIVEAVKVGQKIENFNMDGSGEPPSPESIQALKEFVSSNTTLETCDFECDDVYDIVKEIDEKCEKNKDLKAYKKFQQEMESYERHDKELLYILMRKNPVVRNYFLTEARRRNQAQKVMDSKMEDEQAVGSDNKTLGKRQRILPADEAPSLKVARAPRL